MIVIKTPHPTYTTVLILPNPQFGDGETVVRDINIQRSMDGTPYSYLKTSSQVRLTYSLILTRMKSLELLEFLESFAGETWRLTDHKNDTYVGDLVTNNLQLQNFRRAVYSDGSVYSSLEQVSINIEFEGIKQ